MYYLIIVFLVLLTIVLGLISVQLIRVEKTIMQFSEKVEETVLGFLE
jgi:hypothetical protein